MQDYEISMVCGITRGRGKIRTKCW